MLILLKQGGLGKGGINFDAKLRRGSFDLNDLFYAHIGGIDTFARGLRIAQNILDDGLLSEVISTRYSSYKRGIGRKIMQGNVSLPDLETYVMEKGEPEKISGGEEMLENLINNYIR